MSEKEATRQDRPVGVVERTIPHDADGRGGLGKKLTPTQGHPQKSGPVAWDPIPARPRGVQFRADFLRTKCITRRGEHAGTGSDGCWEGPEPPPCGSGEHDFGNESVLP
jgi:hypothetical protein